MAPPSDNCRRGHVFRLCAGFCQMVFGILTFSIPSWVYTETSNWGLWVRFNQTGNDTGKEEADWSSISEEDGIPAFFQVVRVAECLLLVALIILFLVTLMDGRCLKDTGKWPAVLSFVAVVLAAVSMAVLASNYQDKWPWTESSDDPSLGPCFWMTVFLSVVTLFMCCFHWKHDENRSKEAATEAAGRSRVSPEDQPPPSGSSAAPASSASGASKVNESAGTASAPADLKGSVQKAILTDRRPPPSPAFASGGGIPTEDSLYLENLRSAHEKSTRLGDQQQHQSARGDAGMSRAVRDDDSIPARCGELPRLDRAPAYTLPPVRGARVPPTAPPSYRDVVRGVYAVMPPPPSVAVVHSPFADTDTDTDIDTQSCVRREDGDFDSEESDGSIPPGRQ